MLASWRCAGSILLAQPYVLSMQCAAQLVELQDADPHALPAGKATADLYKCAFLHTHITVLPYGA